MNHGFPFSPRGANALVYGPRSPAITPDDLQYMWAEGLLPPEFSEGPSMDEFAPPGSTARRVLDQEHNMASTLPDMPEDIVRRRGMVGESLRGLQPNNLGNGAVINAYTENTEIVEARGLDCLTPVTVQLGYNVLGQVSSSDDVFVQALVKWGVGGAQHETWVDVGRGTQIRLASASFVSVAMSYQPDSTTSPAGTGPQILGIALLGYG